MKQLLSKVFSTILFGILFISQAGYSNNSNPDSLLCLEIKGKVTNVGSKSSETYQVELIYYNTVVSNDQVGSNKSFKFNLKRDAIYTIRISKDGFITKLISIYTKLPADQTDVYRLDFETELIEAHKSKKLNADALEFPVTIIYYDDKEDSFYFNEEYTSNIKKCVYDFKVVRNKI